MVTAINNSDLGISAAAVNTGSGFRLQVTSRASGAANTFSISGGPDAGVGGMVVAGWLRRRTHHRQRAGCLLGHLVLEHLQ